MHTFICMYTYTHTHTPQHKECIFACVCGGQVQNKLVHFFLFHGRLRHLLLLLLARRRSHSWHGTLRKSERILGSPIGEKRSYELSTKGWLRKMEYKQCDIYIYFLMNRSYWLRHEGGGLKERIQRMRTEKWPLEL